MAFLDTLEQRVRVQEGRGRRARVPGGRGERVRVQERRVRVREECVRRVRVQEGPGGPGRVQGQCARSQEGSCVQSSRETVESPKETIVELWSNKTMNILFLYNVYFS